MKITQLRNATIVVDVGQYRILVDPMLAAAGAIPALKYATRHRRRNPLVELPQNTAMLLDSVTHCLITHCQKGHFDHLDRAGVKWLRQRSIPVYCMETDARFLAAKGLQTIPLAERGTQSLLHGQVTPIPCLHGTGVVGRMMAHGNGYYLEFPDEPSLYIAGDTILTDEVRACLVSRQPDISVIPAGGARFDLGGDIIMDAGEAIEATKLSAGQVIANHLEALDHCPVTRNRLKALAAQEKVSDRLTIPEDGEVMSFVRDASLA